MDSPRSIDGEDPAELDALRAELTAEHQPVGQTEAMLVEDLGAVGSASSAPADTRPMP